MSFFSRIASHDPVLRLLGANDRVDHSGGRGSSLQFSYPMMPGETIGTIAGKLQIPVDELLSSNPALSANTPLTPGLDIALPSQHLDRIIDNITQLTSANTWTGHAPPQPSGSSGLLQPPPLPPDSNHGLPVPPVSDSINIGMPSPGNVGVSNGSRTLFEASLATAPRNPASVSSPPSSTGVAGAQGMAVDRSPYLVVNNSAAGASMGAGEEVVPGLNFSQAASTTIRATQGQHDGDLPPPPPRPDIPDGRPMPLVAATSPPPSWAPQQAMPSAWNSVIAPVDGNQAKLQIMALLAAQIGGSAVFNGSPTVGQSPGFVDPQAVAAYAASMRTGRSIDLGAGRSLELSLASDRLRRVDAIGEEQRSASMGSRRTGDGLDEVARGQRAEEDQQARDSNERQQQERRRLAAIAAMRRRRRPLSTRCRCRHGGYRPLLASAGRYPKGVDLVEFRARRPQRYLWTTAGERANPRDSDRDET